MVSFSMVAGLLLLASPAPQTVQTISDDTVPGATRSTGAIVCDPVVQPWLPGTFRLAGRAATLDEQPTASRRCALA